MQHPSLAAWTTTSGSMQRVHWQAAAMLHHPAARASSPHRQWPGRMDEQVGNAIFECVHQ